MNVLLIAGGWSNEREVSLSGARIIESALKKLGHTVRFFDLADNFAILLESASASDFAFINLHGSPGEDGLVQAMLDQVGCPYQGSGPTASFLALNKAASKEIFQAKGIPTPKWELITDLESGKGATLDLPVFIKPNAGGSSLGMSLVREETGIRPALEKVFEMGDVALVEEYKPGTELTCGILDKTPMPLIMIRPKKDAPFFDYENKYAEDGAEEICPAPVDKEVSDEIQGLTLRAHEALGLEGYSRGDFIFHDGKPCLLEMNTLPGMTATSLVPRAAAQMGFSFEELIAELIRLGMER